MRSTGLLASHIGGPAGRASAALDRLIHLKRSSRGIPKECWRNDAKQKYSSGIGNVLHRRYLAVRPLSQPIIFSSKKNFRLKKPEKRRTQANLDA
jgi:hypothetical protein